MLEIRKPLPGEEDEVWKILEEVISKGDSFVFAPGSSKEEMLAYWFGKDKHVYVVADKGQILGSFILKDNQPGLGSHIANGSYIVAEKAAGRGVGKAMGEFSIEEAARLGYAAMQFNIVVKSNTRAVRLWQKLGFTIIGEIPDAFDHLALGMTNAYIMYRKV